MDTHQRVFGPLNFPQLIVVAVAVLIAHFAWNQIGGTAGAVTAGIVVVGALLNLRRWAPPPFNEEYVRTQRATLGREKFVKWTLRKFAELSAHEAARAAKGLPPDPHVAEARGLIKRIVMEEA